MTGETVELPDMLKCRERRAAIQHEMIKKYHCAIISFCMNIPGPVKTNPDIRCAFEAGKQDIDEMIRSSGWQVCDEKCIHEKTGDEAILAVNADPAEIKKKTTRIEETHPVGRLFDIDVLDSNGQKLSRGTWRKCIICGRKAQDCASRRIHSVREMQDKVDEIINNWKSSK
ncbi:MAG: citrate lyase holo-[acyl-carrier protein] synthase [Bilifractor sp.]|jgi:holo-ACP synthase